MIATLKLISPQLSAREFAHAPRGFVVVFAAVVCAGLAACDGGNSEELSQWVAEQRQQQRVKLPAVAPPKKFTPQAFTAPELADPYSASRLTSALKRETKPAGDGSALVKPELARQAKLKQPLESTPLDGMAYVGQFVKDGRSVALIRVNGLLHQVMAGDRKSVV